MASLLQDLELILKHARSTRHRPTYNAVKLVVQKAAAEIRREVRKNGRRPK